MAFSHTDISFYAQTVMKVNNEAESAGSKGAQGRGPVDVCPAPSGVQTVWAQAQAWDEARKGRR